MASKIEKQEEPQAPNPMKEYVTITLPRATGREEDTLFVSLNGKGYNIKKGTPVRIPKPVYAVLRESERQAERQAAYERRIQDQMMQSARNVGLFRGF